MSQPGPSPARAPPPGKGQWSSWAHWFSVPSPVKRLFDQFPLITYPANALPAHKTPRKTKPVLYVFTTAEEARNGRPSFNPRCLKWQTALRLTGLDFDVVPSNNHAAPGGALPFLYPSLSPSSNACSRRAVPAEKLAGWARQSALQIHEPSDIRYEAYLSLLDHRIKNAWLYAMYLEAGNGQMIKKLYIEPSSSHPLVRLALTYQLREAARDELLRVSSPIRVVELYREADEAFGALETLLGDADWFFGAKQPTLFDAHVFSYTHLLLDDSLGWKDQRLVKAVRSRPRLVHHRERILLLLLE